MEHKKKQGIYVNYTNVLKDHNILDLDRSYKKGESSSFLQQSERSIDKIQKMKSPYFNGEKNKEYIKPQFISSILGNEGKDYCQIKNSVINNQALKSSRMNISSVPGNKVNEEGLTKNYSSINMLNGNRNYHHRVHHLEKFLTNGKNKANEYRDEYTTKRETDKSSSKSIVSDCASEYVNSNFKNRSSSAYSKPKILQCDFTNINDYKKNQLVDSFSRSKFFDEEHHDYRKEKVFKKEAENSKIIETITSKFFKVQANEKDLGVSEAKQNHNVVSSYTNHQTKKESLNEQLTAKTSLVAKVKNETLLPRSIKKVSK